MDPYLHVISPGFCSLLAREAYLFETLNPTCTIIVKLHIGSTDKHGMTMEGWGWGWGDTAPTSGWMGVGEGGGMCPWRPPASATYE